MTLKETLNWIVEKGLYLLKTPSSFKNDPWGMARNQLGHGVGLGTMFTLLFGFTFGWMLYALIEITQYLFFQGEPWDCTRDFGFYLTFASFVHTGNILFLGVYFVFFFSDWLERI